MVTTPSSDAPRRFDAVVIGLHWVTVLLITALFASAWSIDRAADRAEAELLLTLHRSMGAALWLLAVLRLTWRLQFAVLPPFPTAMSIAQQWAAKLSEYALYVLLLVQPLTGLAQTVARGRPFQLFAWTAPKLMERDKPVAGLFHTVHAVSAWILLGLIGLHIAAALFHWLVQRDEVLQSMLPWPPRARAAKRNLDAQE